VDWSAFFDSVGMNIFASVLLVAYLVANTMVAGWLMSKHFDKDKSGWWYVFGTVVGIGGAMLSILSLIAIWADCPVAQCLGG